MKPTSKCATKYCRGVRQKRSRFCCSCEYQHKVEKNPVRVSYQNLKSHATARGIEFSLTLDEFTQWYREEDFIKGKGSTAKSYTVDRIRSEFGYHIWNIQKLTRRDNSSKGRRDVKVRYYDWQSKTAYVYKLQPHEVDDDQPF